MNSGTKLFAETNILDYKMHGQSCRFYFTVKVVAVLVKQANMSSMQKINISCIVTNHTNVYCN